MSKSYTNPLPSLLPTLPHKLRHHYSTTGTNTATGMVMSGSDANSFPFEWTQLYQQTLATASDAFIMGPISDSTVITTISPTNALLPKGRVTKPSRRATRASRRAPTTLLNTDTTNFRAMVQQFTGITGYLPGSGPFINCAGTDHLCRPTAVPFGHLQLQQQYQVQKQYQPSEQFTLRSNSSDFLQGFIGNTRADVEGQDGLLLVGQDMMMPHTGYFQ